MPSTSFKTLVLLHAALVVGASAFVGLAYALVFSLRLFPSQVVDSGLLTAFKVVAVFSLLLIPLAFLIYRKRTAALSAEPNDQAKLEKYRQPFLIRLAFVEGCALINTVFLLLYGDYVFLILAGVAVLVMMVLRPVKAQIAEELRLTNPDF
jgi:hypothetical protein